MFELIGSVWIEKNGILVLKKKNAIHTDLKTNLRNTIHSNVNFALDNLFTTDELQFGSTQDNKDGLLYLDDGDSKYKTMVSEVHASDASGNYYRQWTGTLTASGTMATSGAKLGQDLIAVSSTDEFTVIYSSISFSQINLAASDQLLIHWKIELS